MHQEAPPHQSRSCQRADAAVLRQRLRGQWWVEGGPVAVLKVWETRCGLSVDCISQKSMSRKAGTTCIMKSLEYRFEHARPLSAPCCQLLASDVDYNDTYMSTLPSCAALVSISSVDIMVARLCSSAHIEDLHRVLTALRNITNCYALKMNYLKQGNTLV